MKLLDTYVHTAPSDQNILDIFKGEWLSKMPIEGSEGLDLFNDTRIDWAEKTLGSFEGKSILELGSLEGGHTYMLQNRGAAQIISIEANTKSYLKCLCVKEVFDLDKVVFLLGDFVKFLEESYPFEIVIASGVLYHMTEPLLLLERISKCTDKLFLWTHYYDADVLWENEILRKKFRGGAHLYPLGDKRYEGYTQVYGEITDSNSYCGGRQTESIWLTFNGILDALKQLGFTKLDINFHEPFHPHGPAFAVCAQK